MAPTAPSDTDLRMYAVKVAAYAKVAARFGLRDLFREHQIAPAAPGVWNHVKAFGKHVGEFGRDATFGSPITLAEQLQHAHKATGSISGAIKKYYRDYLFHPDISNVSKALTLGLPLFNLASIARNGDPNTRGADAAQVLSSALTFPITGRLGLPGLVLDQALANGARRIGGAFDPKPSPKPLVPDFEDKLHQLQDSLPLQ